MYRKPFKSFFSSPQVINSVGDQTLLLGEEGEKYRWFLLPSEAAQLLSGKTPAHLPMTAPFTPPRWNTGASVPEGPNSCGAGWLEPCDRTCSSSMEKCTLNSRENLVSPRGNDNDVKGPVDCNCVNGANTDDLSLSSKNSDNFGGENLSTFQCTAGEILNSVASWDANSGEADVCDSMKIETGKVKAKHRDTTNIVCVERRTRDINSSEVGAIDKSNEEISPESHLTNDDDSSLNRLHEDPLSPVDNEASKRISINDDPNSVTNCSSENKGISGDGNALANSETVCRRKPRKNKEKEAASGKPQFHHPPKNIFKPTSEVRNYLTLLNRRYKNQFFVVRPYISLNVSKL